MHYVKLAITKYCWSHTELHLALPCDGGGVGQSWESLEDLNTRCPEAVGFLVPGCHPSYPSESLLERSRLPSNLVSASRYKYRGKGKVIHCCSHHWALHGGWKAIHPWWQPQLSLWQSREKPWHATTTTVVWSSQDIALQCPQLSSRPSAESFILFFLSLWVSHLELLAAKDDLWLLILLPPPPTCYLYECVRPHPAFMWHWGWNKGLRVCKANTALTERHPQLSWRSLVFLVCCKVPSSGCHFSFPCSVFWAEAKRMSPRGQKCAEKQSKGHWMLPPSYHGQYSFWFLI